MPKIGIIGGSGLYEIVGLGRGEQRAVETPFGEPSCTYMLGHISGTEVAFLSRHGRDHRIPPHKINYRANVWGFKALGVERLISVNAAGGINPNMRPGDIVLLEQVIDMTQGARPSTFYESGEVVHIDFTEPYCPELRQCFISTSPGLKTVTYVCVNGPRLETRAEIGVFASMGAELVGMTAMPEAALARELEICYQSLCVVTNPAAGISQKKLTAVEVIEKMKESEGRVNDLLIKVIPLIPGERACPCREALKDAKF